MFIVGARAETVPRGKGDGQESEGIQGLKALGVRDLNYRLAFLACSVKSTNPRVSEVSQHRHTQRQLPLQCMLLNRRAGA